MIPQTPSQSTKRATPVAKAMRIADQYLQCVVYIYPDEQSARDGKWTGGSGFLVHSELHGGTFVVTNKHVIDKMQAPVVRLNCKDNTVDPVSTNPNGWVNHPEGDDIAAIRFPQLDTTKHHSTFVNYEGGFITDGIVHDEHIGIGDQVAMIGRLIANDGRITNTPTARFGFVAMMPAKESLNESEQGIFLVDCQSIPGFSGSPVFLISPSTARGSDALFTARNWLLGIDYKHVYNEEPLRRANGEPIDELHVRANTGIAKVAPAWRIAKLLDYMSEKS